MKRDGNAKIEFVTVGRERQRNTFTYKTCSLVFVYYVYLTHDFEILLESRNYPHPNSFSICLHFFGVVRGLVPSCEAVTDRRIAKFCL